MDADTVFNRYDIRGTYPDEIDETFAERIGKAAGTYAQRHGRGTVVTGRDTRASSEQIYDAFRSGLQSTGAHVVDTGIGTTDRTALAANHYGGIGVMVTASHHAWERTGFKFLYEQGHGFTNADLDRVKELFEHKDVEQGQGESTVLRVQDEFDETYIERVKTAFNDIIDHDMDATVVLDAPSGAGRTAALIFEELGFDVIDVDRNELPAPEPSEETRTDVEELLQDADIAVGYDPDGDRVYVIHPDLGWVDGNKLFYALGTITDADTIVASIDTAPIIEELDANVTYTRVGDVFVSEKGVDIKADLLGEPNGHYAVTDFCWYNSGIFASLLLAAHHDALPDILVDVQDYTTIRAVQVFDDMDARDEAMVQVKKNVAKHFDVVSTVDGLKFEDAENGVTALVRPSGTSPKIRLVVHETGDTGEDGLQDVREQVFAGL